MKILLLGDYSNVHHTLAEGLRHWGHTVVVASDGDGWKDYPRDIDLKRTSYGRWGSLCYAVKAWHSLWGLHDFDVVQLINPIFLPLKAERIAPLYRHLRRTNRSLFLGAFGMDHYWVQAGLDGHTFRYSDFNIGSRLRLDEGENPTFIADWLHGAKGRLNEVVAHDADGIISGLYEYDRSYRPYFADKLRFIPFPIRFDSTQPPHIERHERVRFFIGIQQKRHAYKGTDVMLRALERVHARYPRETEMLKAVSVPFEQYTQMLASADVLLDQLYSYTPAMNALQAMAQGLVVVGGGEPESYDLLGDRDLRPIVNVEPNEESVFAALCRLVEQRDQLPALRLKSWQYALRYHHYHKVARQYLNFWRERLKQTER